MRRWLINLAAALSLVLCAGTVAFWAGSYWRSLTITASVGGSTRHQYFLGVGLWSGGGAVSFNLSRQTWDRVAADPKDMPTTAAWNLSAETGPWRRGLYSFSAGGSTKRRNYPVAAHGPGRHRIETLPDGQPGMIQQGWYVMAPHWAVVLATAILPVTWLHRRRVRAGRVRSGLCVRCGYDLRESKDRCPECGTLTRPQPAEGAAA